MTSAPNGPFYSASYFEAIHHRIDRAGALELTIMGKDPYPGARTHIPFCKPDWAAMEEHTCSGLFVLQSLGIDLARTKARHSLPEDLFVWLVEEHGIAFLNLSYHFLGEVARKGKHQAELRAAELRNRTALGASKNVLLLGEAAKHRWYGVRPAHCLNVVHPDNRNRITRCTKTRQAWASWWAPHQLAARFNLKIVV